MADPAEDDPMEVDEGAAGASGAGPSQPPPEDWLWPIEKMRIEVEIEGPDGETKWVGATVCSVHLDSLFSAEIEGDGETWIDWFTWEDEGTDWRRINPTDGFLLADMQREVAAAAASSAGASSSEPAPAGTMPQEPKQPKTPKETPEEKEARLAQRAREKAEKEARAAERAERAAEKAALAAQKAELAAEKAARKAAKEAEPKKPLSAYIIFGNEQRQRVREENPEASVTEQITLLGAAWKALTEEQRQVYEEKAEADKARYAAECEAAGLGSPESRAAEKAAARAAEKEARAAERSEERARMAAAREAEKAAEKAAIAEAKALAKAEKEAEKAEKEAEKEAERQEASRVRAEKAARKAEKEAARQAKQAEPRKPLSAYIIYGNEHRVRVREANPDATVTELVSLLGAEWKALTEEQRQVYEEKAEADKARYDAECVAAGLGTAESRAAEKAAARAAEKEKRAAEKAAAKAAEKEKRAAEKASAKAAAKASRERARANAKEMRAIEKRDTQLLTAEDDDGNELKVKLRLDMSKAPPKMTKKRQREVQEQLEALSAAAAEEAAQATVEFWAAATARLPKTASYDMRRVEGSRDLANCVLLAPRDRVEWFLILGELMALTEEATRRHGEALKLNPLPTPMPTAYVAQRLDFDDPLWGYQVRDAKHGWLMGVVTLTTFTTWSADFEWNSDAIESGLPAARLVNAWLRNGQPIDFDHGYYYAERDKMTVKEVAALTGTETAELVRLNKGDYKNITGFSKLAVGTALRVCEEDEADFDRKPKKGDTPRDVAKRYNLPVDALIAINREQFGADLGPDTPLKGEALKLRDRDNEVSFEYLMPSYKAEAERAAAARAAEAEGAAEGKSAAKSKGKGKASASSSSAGGGKSGGSAAKSAEPSQPAIPGLRSMDEDGSLTARLQKEVHNGDPTREGVVWPRIAEVGLLISLGGGGTLLRFALQRLKAEGWYHFAACQATLAAVGFYERVGFVRVGAVARYAPKDTSEEELRQLPVCGYQHWQDADELMEEADFGNASYLMVLDLRAWEAGPAIPEFKTTTDHPKAITPHEGAVDLRRMSEVTLEGGHLAYESGDGVVVSLTAEIVAGQVDASQLRMEIRYEVEEIVGQRGSGSSLEYKVKWAKWREATWEPHENLVGASEALEAWKAKRLEKKQKRKSQGEEGMDE